MKKKMKKVKEAAKAMASKFDPQGSYTGKPKDNGKPTQDADDL